MKKIAGMLAALLCLLPLSGCGKDGGASAVEQTNEQLRLHIAPFMNVWLDSAIAEYRARYPEVEVVIDDHSQDQWGTDAEAVCAELAAGEGPDLIFRPDYYFSDIQKAMGAGAFAELTPLLEADPAFEEEEFFAPVVAGGAYEGRLYVMPLTFNLPFLLSSREALDEAGIQLENCGDYLGLAGEVDRYLREGREMRAYNSADFAMYYPTFLGLDYLDYGKRTVDLSAPEFEQAAAFYCRLYAQDVLEESASSAALQMGSYADVIGRKAVFGVQKEMSGEELFLNASAISSKETPVLLPVRAVDGRNTALISDSAAINAKSPNQRNAYDFLTILLSEAWQNENINTKSLPVRRSCLEDRITSAKAVTNDQVFDLGDGNTAPLPPLPESFYEDYRAALDEIGHVNFSYDFFSGEVLSYMGGYYRGEKSFETCRDALAEAMKANLAK